MKKAELVFIPSPGISHLVSTVEMAKLLIHHDDRLSITFLIMKVPFDSKVTQYTDFLSASSTLSNRMRFVELPRYESDLDNPRKFSILIESQKSNVKEIVSKLTQSKLSPDSPRLAGFVLDVFCTELIDVANEFGVPSYIFYTSGAAVLGFNFHMQALHDEENADPTKFKDSDAELVIPSFVNPVPAKVLPSVVLSKDWLPFFLRLARRFRETKGILVNTFTELESHAVKSFSNGKTPPVYPVGPVLNLDNDCHDVGLDSNDHKDIKQWLDDQPPSSVVFLCFGSMGSFDVNQVKEIACALERCGYQFLWSLRKPPPTGKMRSSSDYAKPQEVLPDGFLDRTVETGRVIGWAPQVDILAHPAVGGFVSHCGWNSTLESIWFGVPIAAWPMQAEQQLNAFQLITELGLAAEIKMDYRKNITMSNELIVSSEEIKRGIKCVMECTTDTREKWKEMSEKSRKALINGGSSFLSMGRFIEDMMDNMP